MFKRNIILIVIVLIVIGGLFGAKFWQINSAKESRRPPPPPTVLTTTVASESWQPALSTVGSIHASAGINISNELAGTVTIIHFKSGQAVKKGDLLIELNTSTDNAELKGLVASQTLAQLRFNRQVKLLSKKATSQSNHDESRAELDGAKAAVLAKKSIIDKKKIRAPFSGLIGIRQVNIGQYIDKGFSIAPLQSLSPVFIDFSLAERHFAEISLNQAIEISTQAYPNDIFVGKISAINPGIDQDTRSVKVRASYENTDHKLRAGMFTKINILVANKQTVLTLPDTAISYHTYGENVFVIATKDGKQIAQHRTIKTGKRQQGRVEILDGLQAGDIVVSEGQVKLRNNIPVTIKNNKLGMAATKDSQ